MDKLSSIEAVMNRISEGSVVMVGGFLGVGTPESLVDVLVEKGVKNLTIIGNDTAFPEKGIGKLIVTKQAEKVIVSHIGTNPETGRQMNAGETEVELVPQGTLAERIRAAGHGLGGILTPTGIGTIVEEGKEKIKVDGKDFLLELPLKADIALIKAYKADKKGNLVFRCSSRNFNPLMAMAADFVAVEVENLVEIGEIQPDEVMLPGIFVNALVVQDKAAKAVEGV